MLISVEGTSRLLAAVILALIGVEKAGPFGLALGLAPWLGVAVALRGQQRPRPAGPEASYSELSTALGALLVGSVFAQALLFIGVIAVQLLATEAQADEASRFLNGLIIARIPLFLFQAVQAALLPKLSALAEAGRIEEFRAGFKRLLVVVIVDRRRSAPRARSPSARGWCGCSSGRSSTWGTARWGCWPPAAGSSCSRSRWRRP